MGIRLFPNRLLSDDACFGLFRTTADGTIDLPVTIEGDANVPLHVVHSDPDHLAFLAGLLVVQAWVYGIDEIELPPTHRRPLLVITDHPGKFREAYLSLRLPPDKIRALYGQRRKSLWEKLGIATNANDRREHLDRGFAEDEERDRLHNFFPAKQLLHQDGAPKIIASREHLGRGDSSGAALLIVRGNGRISVKKLQERFSPFLVLIDADGVAVPESDEELPTMIYHESIFSPRLYEARDEGLVVYRLPDAKFENFASQSVTQFIDPIESTDLVRAWARADGAMQTFLELSNAKKDRALGEIGRIATRLRNVLLSLPVGITGYETALRASGQPESLWYSWSVKNPFQSLEARIPEVGAVGEWEEYVFSELVEGLRDLIALLESESPKAPAMKQAVELAQKDGKQISLIVKGEPYAAALRFALFWPAPLGLELPKETLEIATAQDIGKISAEHLLVVPQAFDPHEVFTQLVKAGPRRILLVLLSNELRFVGDRFLRARSFLANSSGKGFFSPLCERAEKLPAVSLVTKPSHGNGLFSDADFQVVERMFSEADNTFGFDTVLGDNEVATNAANQDEQEACLVRLDDGRIVLLEVDGRITYVNAEDQIARNQVRLLAPGDRLIIIRPDAREFIASRVLSSSRMTEVDNPALVIVNKWRTELSRGMEREQLTQTELLQRIRAIGSKRETAAVIGQWQRGEVLGPLDPNDLLRVGKVLNSSWLCENWKRVNTACQVLRTGHRQLGHRVTRIIQRAAIGEFSVTSDDEMFLKEIGITVGQLQDAVTLVGIDQVSVDTQRVPIYRLGTIYSV